MVRVIVVLSLCALLPAVAVAQYGNLAASGGAFMRGMPETGSSRLTFTSIELPELKGVWRTVGSQQPESAYEAMQNMSLPDCDSDSGEYSYQGLDTTADQYLVLAGTAGVTRMIVNQQRSTFSPNVTYNASLILAEAHGMTSCTHFRPYVDLATGELMAESIGMTQWSTNSSSPSVTRANLNCQVTGTELPGCYNGQVSRSQGASGSSAPTVAVASIGQSPAAARAPGSVLTVTRTTYVCGNGECLRLSPKYASVSPVYGG